VENTGKTSLGVPDGFCGTAEVKVLPRMQDAKVILGGRKEAEPKAEKSRQ